MELVVLFYKNQKECKGAMQMVKRILAKVFSFIPDEIELHKLNKSKDEFQINKNLINLFNENKNAYVEKIEEIQIVEEGGKKWVGAVEYNDKIYFIPNGINKFLVFDTKNEKYDYIPIEQENKEFMWTGGCEYLGKIYGFPRTANTLLSLDVKTNKVEEIDLGLNYKSEHHYGGVQVQEWIIFQPPRDNNHILKIDIKNKKVKKIYISPKLLNIRYRYTSGILHPNNNIYFFPERNRRIMVLNTKTEQISFIGEKISTMVFDAVIAKDGNIYGFSSNEKGILKIDVRNKTTEMIHKEIGVSGCYGTKMGINGKIYGIPGNGKNIYEYDIENDEVKIIYSIEENIKAKCAGGVVTKDGTIYTVPALGNKMYRYCFKNVKKEISKGLLDSIYFKDNY